MSDVKKEISICGLDRIEAAELLKNLGQGGRVQFDESSEQDILGDLGGTTVVVILTVAVLKSLSIFLAKSRKKILIKCTEEVVSPEGACRKREISIELDESFSETEVLKAISDFVDMNHLVDYLGGGS